MLAPRRVSERRPAISAARKAAEATKPQTEPDQHLASEQQRQRGRRCLPERRRPGRRDQDRRGQRRQQQGQPHPRRRREARAAERRHHPDDRRRARRAERDRQDEDRQAIVGAGHGVQRTAGIARKSACVNRTSDAPSTGPIAASTPITITSLGTKASV